MTGYEIAEKLRQLNRWRWGDDETLLMPDPAAIGRWIDASAEALELLARATAANVKLLHELYEHRVPQYAKELAALRARVAELEATTLARAESTAPKEVLP